MTGSTRPRRSSTSCASPTRPPGAALALGAQKNPEAAAALLSVVLDDADLNVRFHAIESLGKIGSAAAVESLAAIASHAISSGVPRARRARAHQRPRRGAENPAAAERRYVRRSAAEALGQIADEDAVPPLVAALDRQTAVVPSIVDALPRSTRATPRRSAPARSSRIWCADRWSPAGANRVIDAVPQASGRQLRNPWLSGRLREQPSSGRSRVCWEQPMCITS
jgi:HEAT repeat protein